MSLINQMLQDLEKRGEDTQSHAASHYVQFGDVVNATNKGKRSAFWLLSLAIVAFIAVYFVVSHRSSVKPVVPVPVPVSQASHSMEAASAVSVQTRMRSSDAVPDTSPALSELGLSLKLSTQVNTVALSVSHEVSQVSKASLSTSASSASEMSDKTTKNQTKQDKQDKQDLLQLKTAQVAVPEVIATTEPVSSKKVSASTALSQSSLPVTMIKEVSVPQRAEGEYRQATVYQQQGRVSEALSALENALKLDPTHAPARQLLISLLLENKRHDDAIRELRQGLVQDPAQLNFSMILARLLVERAKLSEAIEVLQKNLVQAQDRPDYVAFLAALQQKTGHHKEAIALYRQALRGHSQNGAWWMGLGISLQAEASVQEAIEAYKQAKQQPGLSAELHAFIDQKISQLQK